MHVPVNKMTGKTDQLRLIPTHVPAITPTNHNRIAVGVRDRRSVVPHVAHVAAGENHSRRYGTPWPQQGHFMTDALEANLNRIANTPAHDTGDHIQRSIRVLSASTTIAVNPTAPWMLAICGRTE